MGARKHSFNKLAGAAAEHTTEDSNMNLARTLIHAPALILLATLGLSGEAGGQDDAVRTADGLIVYLGVLPAAMIQGYSADYPEGAMHGGVPRGRDAHHVTVAVFDTASGERVESATVEARIAAQGMVGTTRQLERMLIADTVTFGNYFTLRGEGPFDIEITIMRPGAEAPVTVQFSHPHPSR
jgi:hypothetical protein